MRGLLFPHFAMNVQQRLSRDRMTHKRQKSGRNGMNHRGIKGS